jgi:hypothetical protein
VLVAAAAALVVASWLLWRYAPTTAGRGVSATVPRFYLLALRALARRGMRRGPTETAREFARRVDEAAPGIAAAFARLTAAYERCRFGSAALTPEEAAGVEAAVLALRGR